MDIVEKLQIKSGMKGKVLNKPRGVELSLRNTAAGKDFAVVFVKKQEDVRGSVESVTQQLRDDGLLWYCYPKRSANMETDINRDNGWDALHENGFRGVRQIAIDSTWSALRFRDRKLVKRKT